MYMSAHQTVFMCSYNEQHHLQHGIFAQSVTSTPGHCSDQRDKYYCPRAGEHQAGEPFCPLRFNIQICRSQPYTVRLCKSKLTAIRTVSTGNLEMLVFLFLWLRSNIFLNKFASGCPLFSFEDLQSHLCPWITEYKTPIAPYISRPPNLLLWPNYNAKR